MVQMLIGGDPLRWRLLDVVRALALPDCWIGAGFVRNAVWDHLHGRPLSAPSGDVDVLWFDTSCTDPNEDRRLEALLRAAEPSIDWSVKNQARMHLRNGDAPYRDASDAMRHWPETATAVAVRRTAEDFCEVSAPLGLEDLFNLQLKPTPRFTQEKHAIYQQRITSKGWLNHWPLLKQP
jgi:hypothetical protein